MTKLDYDILTITKSWLINKPGTYIRFQINSKIQRMDLFLLSIYLLLDINTVAK